MIFSFLLSLAMARSPYLNVLSLNVFIIPHVEFFNPHAVSFLLHIVKLQYLSKVTPLTPAMVLSYSACAIKDCFAPYVRNGGFVVFACLSLPTQSQHRSHRLTLSCSFAINGNSEFCYRDFITTAKALQPLLTRVN